MFGIGCWLNVYTGLKYLIKIKSRVVDKWLGKTLVNINVSSAELESFFQKENIHKTMTTINFA